MAGNPGRVSRNLLSGLVLAFLLAGGLAMGVAEALRRFHSPLDGASFLKWQYAFAGVAAAVVIVAVMRKVRSRLAWEIVFTTTLFLGVWYLALLVLPFGWGIAIASALTLLSLILRTCVWHDLFVLVGCVGVAMNFAGWLAPDVLLVGLVVMTLYDTLAGPPGGPILELASSLVRFGMVPGLVLVARIKDLFRPVNELVHGDGMLLGAGDLVLPIALVSRAAIASAWAGGVVLAGLMVGVVVLGRGSGHPRAALPPLAAGTCIPFFVLRLLGAL